MEVSKLTKVGVENAPIDPNWVTWVPGRLDTVTITVPDQIAVQYAGDLVGLMKALEIDEFLLDFILYLNGFTNPAAYRDSDTTLLSYDKDELLAVLRSR